MFALPDSLSAKADPTLIGPDHDQLTAVAARLSELVAELDQRLADLRRATAGTGRRASDRDLEIHRLSSRLRLLRRFGLDLCLGRMVFVDGSAPVYVGRIGLTDRDGRQLLVDWRTPAAEPFFAATFAHPQGLASRRRYRWSNGRITDYWDEVFTVDGLQGSVALDEDSAFIASLGSSRSPQMRDVLSTIQADQDAIIRAGSRGALVVDGGPGTGKTVVALHRAAYLLYADPRLNGRRGGVLFVGPHRPYLAYVADVLPSLGEDGVQICTLRDLVIEGADAVPDTDPEVARLKSSVRMVEAVEPAVRLYEEPPTEPLLVETYLADVWLSAADWAEAFASVEAGTPHNEARDQVWQALVAIMIDNLDDPDLPHDQFRRAVLHNEELTRTFTRSWTLIEAADLVGDLWTVPAYLRRCAPWLDPDQVRLLQRAEPQAWTLADLPLLDAARLRLGDPEASRRNRRREAAIAEQREVRDRATESIMENLDGYAEDVIMLKGQDLQDALLDTDGLLDDGGDEPDRLAGPFAHVIVDEAQELTDAEWQLLLRRCPSRSFTIVGDRSQARRGFTESWTDRLERVGFEQVTIASLTVNYRTPQEVMAVAEPVIRAAHPDPNVPTSIRRTGLPVRYGSVADLDSIVRSWLVDHEGVACVVGDPAYRGSERVRSLSPQEVKGLEFDLVVLVDPDAYGDGIQGAVDRYVAMTRATQELVILGRSR